jgi:PST family polysaccharide transporter
MADQFDQVSEENGNRGARNITHRTLSGFFWTFSGTGIQVVLRVLVLALLARLLTPADFGLVGAALIIVSFSEIFSQLGVGSAVVQRPNLEERHLRTGFTVSVLFGVMMAGLLWLLASDIAGFFRMKELTSILRALVLIFPLQGMSVIAESLLQRELQFRPLAGIEVASYAVGYGVVGVSLAFMGFGTWSLVWAYLTQEILRSVILLVVQRHPKSPQFDPCAFKELVSFGGGFSLAQICGTVATQGDNFIVGRYLGVEALGLYSRVYQLMALPATLFTQVVDKVLFPVMAKIQNETERLATAYRRGAALTALLVLPASTVMIVLGPEIIQVGLGAKWTEAVVPFQVLTLGTFFRTGYKMSGTLARAKGAVYDVAWRQGVYAILVVVVAWIAYPYGITGIAIAVVGVLFVQFLLLTHLSIRLTTLGWKDFLIAHVPAVIITLIVGPLALSMTVLLRELHLSEGAVLLSTLSTTFVCIVITVRTIPQVCLGPDALWWVQLLSRSVWPSRNRKIFQTRV